MTKFDKVVNSVIRSVEPSSLKPIFVYEGKIEQLVIVAGMNSSGKSDLLHRPTERVQKEDLPPGLEDLHIAEKQYSNLFSLGRSKKQRFDCLYLHFDLTIPIKFAVPPAPSRDQIMAASVPDTYETFVPLRSCIRRASQVDILTLFVRREPNFSRWLYKPRENNKVSLIAAAIQGDTSGNSELHRRIYRAWLDFIDTVSIRSSHILDANTEQYHLVERDELEAELINGYSS